ncbi:MAG: dihydrolipoyl dehydrogenase [Candidatus Aquirickettsiella gammari]|uniref:Dihydrolipoyl dehydrogenase n=1 Tax=Candidatus Aquirickettsiella gammari TaxID=2016198 RepID=A0A370CGW7_9COXI|nr:MAG: dihydrolipoyl dehydrogenase [Candidatus Aquirickettsiella gammari]
MAELEIKKTEVLVLGSGPGGYSAAFRAADLGKKVILVEKEATLGGVCLNVGCIPSKALLHAAKVIEEAQAMAVYGLEFGKPKIDINKLRTWKESVVKKLTGGLSLLAKQRKVECLQGEGKFTGKNELTVGQQKIEFQQAIIAVGSQVVRLPFLPDDPRIIDSTGALELKEVKGELLVLGGGIIGMEMATVYHALGAKITVVEAGDRIINTADADIVMPLYKRLMKNYKFLLKTKVTQVEAKPDGLWVTFAGEGATDKPQRYDQILSAVGRKPNGKLIGAEALGVEVTEQGFIPVDKQLRTNIAHIFAIGDVVGNPMLAHKAVAEGRVAAEVIAGKKHFFEPRCIPSVAYTDPEIAWVGLTETLAKEKNIPYEKAVFPWLASGRSLGQARDEGLTKLLFEPKTQRILGAGIVGPNAGELIGEIALAIEMGCEAEDIALTIHPHPTLSETIMLASEIFEGTITDLYMPKKK